MKAIQRLTEVLLNKYGMEIPMSEIGYETVELYKEEIDEQLVPPAVIDHLEDPVATESACYMDDKGDEYLVIVIETSATAFYEVWMVNNEVKPDFASGMD